MFTLLASFCHVLRIKNSLKPQLTVCFDNFSLRSKNLPFKLDRNKDLTFIVMIIDIDISTALLINIKFEITEI